jgi:hypothetical protein
MVKNGQSYGTVQFNGPVINGTYGPDLVLRLGNGTDIFLHPLIGISTATVHNKESRIDDFVLMQNYPMITIEHIKPNPLLTKYIRKSRIWRHARTD